ncbi:MAG: hypothetical protein ACYCZR_01880 [Burkholderiales bacterium]
MKMNKSAISENIDIQGVVSQMMGCNLEAMALVCSVNEDSDASVAAFITPKGAKDSPRFRHAVEMEEVYSDTLLSFDVVDPPYYGVWPTLNLHQAAVGLGVDRILCLVTLDEHGDVNAARNYAGVEVTMIEAAQEQLIRFKEILDGLAMPRKGTLQ